MCINDSLKKQLEGFHLLLCRPAEKVASLARKLEDLGATVQIFSPLSFRALELDGEGKKIFQNLTSFSHLIFSSTEGVHFFEDFLRSFHPSFLEEKKPGFRIGVVGEKTARKLESMGLWKADFMENSLESLLDKMALGETERAIHFTSLQSLEKINLSLNRSLNLLRFPIYQSLSSEISAKDVEKIAALDYHITLVGSPSCWDSLQGLLSLKKFPLGALAVLGKTTAEYLKKEGHEVAILPASPKEEEVFQALCNYLKK